MHPFYPGAQYLTNGPSRKSFIFRPGAHYSNESRRKLNIELRRFFQKLGYDGFVYRNEIESAAESADSCVVFDARQITIFGEERVVSTQAHHAA